jgi:hypothetical protein
MHLLVGVYIDHVGVKYVRRNRGVVIGGGCWIGLYFGCNMEGGREMNKYFSWFLWTIGLGLLGVITGIILSYATK